MHTARNLLPRTAAALGGLALLSLAASCSGRPGETAPSVILVTVDTLRADRVGLYGGGAAPTPHMDRIGREGAFVETAVTPVGRTTQAVSTILTGLHPFRHGVEGLDITLPLEMTTLAERFRARGYRTAAFVSNVNLAPGRNFEQGFEIYRNPAKRWKGNSADAISREAIAWLERSKPAGPIFLWVHYLDPHWPYEPAAEFSQRTDPDWHGTLDIVERQDRHEISKGQILYGADRLLDARSLDHVRRLYDAEVAATDAAIGVLLEGLGQHGLLDDSILGFTADHGEAMGEHGYWFGHGDYLYDETLRVPLAFRAPRRIPAGTRLTGVAHLEDVAPTLLALAGAPGDGAEFDGRDLSPLLGLGGDQPLPPKSQLQFNDHQHIPPESPRRAIAGRAGRWLGVRDGDWKLIRIPVAPGQFDYELYQLHDDPNERQNLAAQRTDQVTRLRALLEDSLARYQVPRIDDGAETAEARRIDALRSLGYIDK